MSSSTVIDGKTKIFLEISVPSNEVEWILLWILQVFFALTMAAIGISQSSTFAPDSSKAKVAAASIFAIIDRKSKIDSSDETGTVLENVKGDIELRHLSFTYPARPGIQIFRDLCLTIRAGKVKQIFGPNPNFLLRNFFTQVF